MLKTFERNGRTYAKITDLKPWEENPRGIKDQRYEDLVNDILEVKALDPKTEGQFKPLIVTTLGVVIGGNMRLRAYGDPRLSITDVWVSIVDTNNPAQAFKIAIKDNERYGYYEEDKLAELALKYELTDVEMEGLYVDMDEPLTIKNIVDDVAPDPEVNEDDQPEPEEKYISAPGTIYQLGHHRLMCGDSTDPKAVDALMAGAQADMVFTDPPYNVNYSGRGKKTSNTILNDHMSDDAFQLFLNDTFENYQRVTKKQAGIYVCYASSTHREFETALELYGFKIKNQIIWVKPVASMGWGDYRWKHEPILYASQDGKTNYYGDRKQYTEWHFEPTDEELLEWAREQIDVDESGESTVWAISRDVNYEHPTQKPVKLAAKAIENSSRTGDLVLDLFLGGGTTLIAAEQLNRICYGMELDPRYADVIRKRYAKYIGREDDWEAATPAIEQKTAGKGASNAKA